MEESETGVPELDPELLEPLWPPPLQAVMVSRARAIKVEAHVKRTVFTLVSTGPAPGFSELVGRLSLELERF